MSSCKLPHEDFSPLANYSPLYKTSIGKGWSECPNRTISQSPLNVHLSVVKRISFLIELTIICVIDLDGCGPKQSFEEISFFCSSIHLIVAFCHFPTCVTVDVSLAVVDLIKKKSSYLMCSLQKHVPYYLRWFFVPLVFCDFLGIFKLLLWHLPMIYLPIPLG